jgi:hypothetical protein
MAEQISQRTEGAELSVTQNGLALLMEETSGSIWLSDNVEHQVLIHSPKFIPLRIRLGLFQP